MLDMCWPPLAVHITGADETWMRYEFIGNHLNSVLKQGAKLGMTKLFAEEGI